jgi:beta-glucanase (GH16 family)
MQKNIAIICCFILTASTSFAQTLQDNFEGNGNVTTWLGDDCTINATFTNPYPSGINTSTTVLKYEDQGGLYANVRLDASQNFNINSHSSFSLKLYVPSNGISGNQTNQVSLKLQNGQLESPWVTQCEIVKTITLNQWQEITFDFSTDIYINLDGNSPSPTQRADFNRVVIQLNGENNNDKVVAYLDDFSHQDTIIISPVFNKLVWSDEFDVDGSIDDTKWFQQTKLPAGGSWYNGEIQHYTNQDSNAYVTDGMLHLVARKESFTDQGVTKTHTSARLNSKFIFTYGRVEVRAKLPSGVGTWPAIWTLGQNISETGAYWEQMGYGKVGWPACGEIDIMEHWGNNQNYISSATHTPSSYGNTVNVAGQIIPTASTEFHIYALEWTNDKLVFSVDSVIHFVYNPDVKNPSSWPYTDPQYILLNIALQPSISTNFTKGSMDIDYVRVYEEGTNSIEHKPVTHTPFFYPNPVLNRLTIQLNNPIEQQVVVKIYSVDGKLISTDTLRATQNKIEINELSKLPGGMYMADFSLNNHNYNLKFIKQ